MYLGPAPDGKIEVAAVCSVLENASNSFSNCRGPFGLKLERAVVETLHME